MPDLPPSAFASILASNERPLIVGGQAVNIWAEIYAPSVPLLETFAPFMSVDADIYGTRAMAESLAKRAGWQCHAPKGRDSIAVAILTKTIDPEQPPLAIEVIGEVNGLEAADLAMNVVVELQPGQRYRIPSPTVLLKAKLYNLASLANQDRPQDKKHVRMLLEIVPRYFAELGDRFKSGAIGESDLRGEIEYLVETVRRPFAQNMAHAHGLDFSHLIPEDLRLHGPEFARKAAQILFPSADGPAS